MIDAGFSRDYFSYRTKGFFFSPSGPAIETNEAFDFVKTLEPTPPDIFCRSHDQRRDEISTAFPAALVDISDQAPIPQSTETRERNFLKRPDKASWLVVKDIQALDARAASDDAKGRINTLVSIASFHVHRQPIRMDGETLVYGDKKIRVLQALRSRGSPRERVQPRTTPWCVCADLAHLGTTSHGYRVVRVRFLAALGLHSSAIASSELAVQLTTLWAAIEALLPLGAEDVKIRSLRRRWCLRLLGHIR